MLSNGPFLASELSIEKKKILDRQDIASQWGLQLIFRMHNSDPTPQRVDNRNIILWSNDSNVILKYFHFVLLVVFF
jgi:hypothetical protein